MTAEHEQRFREPLKPRETEQSEPTAYINPEFTFDWNDYLIRFTQDRPDIQLPQVRGKVLEVITRRANMVIPHESYCELVWDSPHYEHTNLKPHIANLRQQTDDVGPGVFNIRLIPDLGYVLQDHNWESVAESIPLTEDGTIRYYPDTRDFTANGSIVPLTKTEAKIVQTLAKSIGNPVRHHHLSLHGHSDRHSKGSTAVHIHRLNKKLSMHGVSIKSVLDIGYTLSVDSLKTGNESQ